MIEPLSTILSLLKVLFTYIVLFIFLPSRIVKFDQESGGFLDRIFISLIHSTAVIILLVHFLAFLKLYETISLAICLITAYIAATRKKGKIFRTRVDALGMRIIAGIFDIAEGRLDVRQLTQTKCRSFLKTCEAKLKTGFKYFLRKPFSGLFLMAVLVFAAYVRFNHSLIHLFLGASDSYVHLAWSKYLGYNQIYRDGIYSFGYHCIISALNKIFFTDPYVIVRFIGPIAGIMIVLSLFYVIKASYRNEWLAWLAVFIYVFNPGLPADVWRQISALPQEYSMIFFLPGLHFLNMFFKYNKKKYLFLASECLAITVLIHPYVSVFLVMGYAVVIMLNIKALMKLRVLMPVSLYLSASVFTGILPIALGFALGIKPHVTFEFIIRSSGLSADTVSSRNLNLFQENNQALKILLIISALFIFYIVLLEILKCFKIKLKVYINTKEFSRISSIFIITSLLIYVFYRSVYFGLPPLMDASRTGIFLSLIAVAVIALPVGLPDLIIKNIRVNNILKLSICIITVCAIFFQIFLNGYYIPTGVQLEYDEAVLAYLKIKKDYPPMSWTIVSPVEQLSQTMGYGYHYELWEFVKELENPQKLELSLPTDYIFIFVEKIPLKTAVPVNREDAAMNIPELTENMDEYYKSPLLRRIIESKAFFWAEEYMKHCSNMKIFLDTNCLRVYIIKQDGRNPINLQHY